MKLPIPSRISLLHAQGLVLGLCSALCGSQIAVLGLYSAVLSLCSAVLGWHSTVLAAEKTLVIHNQLPQKVRIDGMLHEWTGDGWQSLAGKDGDGLRFVFATNDEALYVVLQFSDQHYRVSSKYGADEDHVELLLAPVKGGKPVYEVALYPGGPGGLVATAFFASKTNSKAKRKKLSVQVVEAHSANGYTLEAKIPWRILPKQIRGLNARAALRWIDRDNTKTPFETATASRSRSSALPAPIWHVLGKTQKNGIDNTKKTDPVATFLQHKGYRRSDVGQSVRLKRGNDQSTAYVVKNHVLLVDGDQSTGYRTLSLPENARIMQAKSQDVTGDTQKELVIRWRWPRDGVVHELWQAAILFPEARWLTAFETSRRVGKQLSTARIVVDSTNATIRLVSAPKRRSDVLKHHVPPNAVAMRTLANNAQTQTFRWDGNAFHSIVHADKNSPPVNKSKQALTPESAGYSQSALIRQYIASRSFATTANVRLLAQDDVAQDSHREDVMVLDKTLLVMGQHFDRGQNFTFVDLPVAQTHDVLKLRLWNIGDDNKREILVWIRRSASGAQRNMLLVYGFVQGALKRIGSIEIGRSRKRHEIQHRALLARSSKGCFLKIKANELVGWGPNNYPFADPPAQNSDFSILLPWQSSAQGFMVQQGQLIKRPLAQK